ncbi:MAG: tetratricopeptide repeat protein [Alphaproteobacteria bacterium]
MGRTRRLTIFLFLVLFPATVSGQAPTCPPGSEEVFRQQTETRITVKCACVVGLALINGKCVEPAKLDRATYDAVVGIAFTDGKAMRDYLRQKADWPLDLITHIALAVSRAEQGFTREALGLLRAARERVPSDPRVTELITKLEDLERIRWRDMRPGRFDPKEGIKGLPPATAAKLMTAELGMRVGDYDGAIELLMQAVKEQPADQGLRDALVVARQMKAARDDRLRPDDAREKVRRMVPTLAGQAAWNLGYIAAEANDSQGAIAAFEEARGLINRDAADDHYWLGRLIQFQESRKGQTNSGAPNVFDMLNTLSTMSKTDLMFDALDYGRRDWSRSLSYLDRILVLYPGAPQARAARDELAAIAATAK